jgi:hypothetical protein
LGGFQTAANARKWETDEMDFHHLAEELAQFTAGRAP